MQDSKTQIQSKLTESLLDCCFAVMSELGAGCLEKVYKKALIIAMRATGVSVQIEKGFEILFRGHKIGTYVASMIVNKKVIIELKCCEELLSEHQSLLISYLKSSGIAVGLLVNFGRMKLEYKRLYHPIYPAACDHSHPVFS